MAALLGFAPAALGMGVHTTSTSLARSSDGRTGLVEEDGAGPEGGGTLSFVVVERQPRRFLISNNLSNGGPRPWPQQVSEKACRDQLTQLKALLEERGFKGVAVHPEVCSKDGRDGALTTDAPR